MWFGIDASSAANFTFDCRTRSGNGFARLHGFILALKMHLCQGVDLPPHLVGAFRSQTNFDGCRNGQKASAASALSSVPHFHVRRGLCDVDASEGPVECGNRKRLHRQLGSGSGAESQTKRSGLDLADVRVVGPVVRASKVRHHPGLAVLLVGGLVGDLVGVASASPLRNESEDGLSRQHELAGSGRANKRPVQRLRGDFFDFVGVGGFVVHGLTIPRPKAQSQ